MALFSKLFNRSHGPYELKGRWYKVTLVSDGSNVSIDEDNTDKWIIDNIIDLSRATTNVWLSFYSDSGVRDAVTTEIEVAAGTATASRSFTGEVQLAQSYNNLTGVVRVAHAPVPFFTRSVTYIYVVEV